MPGELVEPLFYTCWMHRALKESTRLTAGDLERGHYFSVLRASIKRREALASLFTIVGYSFLQRDFTDVADQETD